MENLNLWQFPIQYSMVAMQSFQPCPVCTVKIALRHLIYSLLKEKKHSLGVICIHISWAVCNLGAQPRSLAVERSRLPKSPCGLTLVWKSKPHSPISCWGVGEGACSPSYLRLLIFVQPANSRFSLFQTQSHVKISCDPRSYATFGVQTPTLPGSLGRLLQHPGRRRSIYMR